jgi:peptidoglycan/xylan/chitin deacetylase (PgdA/CDA1 family)
VHQIQRAVLAVARVAQTRYPRFIFGLPPAPEEIPVFNYHDVDPPDLRRDLDFLRRNGYRTVGLEEFDRSRRAPTRERLVLLTFDDARRSFWEAAFPVLVEYGARAALFAPTWWMNETAAPTSGRRMFMTWSELRACAASGLVDVQSHAHRHALVHTSGDLVEFASPESLARYDIYDWPMRNGKEGDEHGAPALGTPVYRAAPLLSARRRYLESSELAGACRELVVDEGGAKFFARPDWRRTLHAFHAARSAGSPGRTMEAAAFERLVASELECSRDEFRAHLGYAPTYLAFPWRLGSRASLELANRLGFRAAFGVALDYRAERARLPVRVYGRFKCDWLRLLPGDGRASMLDTIGRKLSRLSSIQHLAH